LKTQWALVLALLFSLVVAIFAIVNNEMVPVNFLFGSVEISAVLLILGSAAAGAIIMTFLSLVRHVRVGFEVRDLKKKIKHLEEDLKVKEELLAKAAEQEMTEEEVPSEARDADTGEVVDLQEDR
jgi:lipopolysaccharide assembly protein A